MLLDNRRAARATPRTLVVLVTEVAAGALALALYVRFSPLPAVRDELWMRLTAAGVLGEAAGPRRRLASLVLGRPEPAAAPEASP